MQAPRTILERIDWRAREAFMIVFLGIVLPICVAVAYVRNKDSVRADVHRVLGRTMDAAVTKLASSAEPIIGAHRRVAFIEWYGELRGWETFEAHRMTKDQIERAD